MSTFLVAGAVIGGCVGGYSGISSIRKYNHNITDQFWENVAVLNRQYSYAQNELDKQAVYAKDEAQSEMYQASLNAYRNNALVESALSESGLEGRSQKAVSRDVKGQSNRQQDNIQASYENAIYSIKSQKDSLHVEYAQNITNMRDAIKPLYKHGFQAINEIGQQAAIGAFIGYMTAGAGGAVGGALGSSAGSAAGSSVGTGLSASATGASGLTAGGASLGSGLSSFGLAGSSGTVGASSALSSMGVGATTGATAGSSVGTLANTGLSSSVASSGFNWGQFASQAMKYYNTANKYYNYYQNFSNTFSQYYNTYDSYYNTNRYRQRRGTYY